MSNPGGKRYRIERTLGEGTYGKVKLAYDNYTREKVSIHSALKLFMHSALKFIISVEFSVRKFILTFKL